MITRIPLASVLIACAVSATPTWAQTPRQAYADLKDLKGAPIGSITLTQHAQGVLLRYNLQGAPPGWHAMHIHETGICEPPFASAGEHFNPGAEEHGYDADGTHAGDMPNVFVAADGTAVGESFNNRIALSTDQPTDVNVLNRAIGAVRNAAGMETHNVFAGRGSSVVLHLQPDDYRTNPSGGASDRIACGVILKR